MNRRDLLASAAAGAAAIAGGSRVVVAAEAGGAPEYFPVKVDESLFSGVNRVKDPSNERALAKLHSPVISVPGKVKAGEVFKVEVTIGEMLHPMEPDHWIEYLQLNIGNEPAGTLLMRSHGYMKPEGTFYLKLDETLKGKKISLVVQVKCNLHGIWENHANVDVG
jgi:superoxide reductase